MDHQADYPGTYPEYDLDRFETAPSLGVGVHRVRGEAGVHTFFVSIQQGLPLSICVSRDLHRDAPVGASVFSVLVSNEVTADQKDELNRIMETVLSLAAPASVSLSDEVGLVEHLPIFAFVMGRLVQ